MRSAAWLIAMILICVPYLVACENDEEKYQNVSNVRSKVVQHEKDMKEAQKGKKKRPGGRLSKIKSGTADDE